MVDSRSAGVGATRADVHALSGIAAAVSSLSRGVSGKSCGLLSVEACRREDSLSEMEVDVLVGIEEECAPVEQLRWNAWVLVPDLMTVVANGWGERRRVRLPPRLRTRSEEAKGGMHLFDLV